MGIPASKNQPCRRFLFAPRKPRTEQTFPERGALSFSRPHKLAVLECTYYAEMGRHTLYPLVVSRHSRMESYETNEHHLGQFWSEIGDLKLGDIAQM